jgi:hypothetical protein
MPRPPHSPWFDLPYNIWWWVQTMKLPIVQLNIMLWRSSISTTRCFRKNLDACYRLQALLGQLPNLILIRWVLYYTSPQYSIIVITFSNVSTSRTIRVLGMNMIPANSVSKTTMYCAWQLTQVNPLWRSSGSWGHADSDADAKVEEKHTVSIFILDDGNVSPKR